MLSKPNLLKIPDASHSIGGYNDPACGYFDGDWNYQCNPHTPGVCLDTKYTAPKPSCDWTLGIGAVAIVGGAILSSPT